MKTKFILLSLFIIGLMVNSAKAQTIAVADFSTSGVHATPKIVAKLTRLELVKINKYVVMDESDMDELLTPEMYENCYGKNCLTEMGEQLGVPLIMAGTVDGLGNKIVITIKLVDVKSKTIQASKSMEFDNQEIELQRMLGIVIQEMHDITPDPETKKRLAFNNEVIISNNVGKMNNSGPRMGVAFLHESDMYDFYRRSETQGGLGIFPAMTNLGYQFEGQYIGTENFSALAEFIVNVGGMEQGQFIPSFTLLNGFRFGKQGWEFAFGPSFGFRRTSLGFFAEADKNLFGREIGRYWSQSDFYREGYDDYVLTNNGYEFSKNLDKRGNLEINTNWLMAFGRTFKAGALNIPVNVYYSYNKYGGVVGTSVGFNVTKTKTNIN